MTARSTKAAKGSLKHQTAIGIAFNCVARLLWGGASWVISLSRSNEVLRVFEQRLFWSFVFTVAVLLFSGQGPAMARLIRDRMLGISTVLAAAVISLNWFAVIWCVKHEALASAGLGFLAAPILTVVGGIFLLGERGSPAVVISLLICAGGVGVWFENSKIQPWPACYIAASSAAYALLRKRFPLPSLVASTAETGLALTVATCLLLLKGGPVLLLPPEIDGLSYSIILGLVTTLPMLFYVRSLQSIPVSVSGYLQYITPTAMLFIAFGILNEPIAPQQLTGVGLIWLSIVIFLASALLERQLRRVRATRATVS